MHRLIEETTLNGMTLPNRLVGSATWEGMCEPSGKPTENLVACYRDSTHGGVGLIITGYAFVRPEGQQLPGKMGIHTDDFADAFNHLTREVHGAGGTIAIQLVHAGGQALSRTTGLPTVAPSASMRI